jgi:hypothetical protein
MWRQFNRIVEIGVDQGQFSECFFNRHWNISMYIGVDDYGHFAGSDREMDQLAAIVKYRDCAAARIIRRPSTEVPQQLLAADDIYRNPYDFIYVDGDHSEEAVYADLKAWWPTLRDGGIMAGHDWWMVTDQHLGVKQAVMRFAEEHGVRKIYHTYMDDPQSWYFYKQQEPADIHLINRRPY